MEPRPRRARPPSRRAPPGPALLLLAALLLLRGQQLDASSDTSTFIHTASGKKFVCLPQAFGTQTISWWNVPSQPVVRLRPAQDVCSPSMPGGSDVATSSYGATFTTGPDVAALANLAAGSSARNAVALVLGSACAFSDSAGYATDLHNRVAAATSAGATGVLYLDGLSGKPPVLLGTFALPTCIVRAADGPGLLALFGSNSSATFDFSDLQLYTAAAETTATPAVLASALATSPSLGRPLLAYATNFVPASFSITSGRVVAMVFDASCSQAPLLSTFAACAACWALGSAALTNRAALRGAVAFYNGGAAAATAAGPVGCFSAYFHWAQLAADAAAAGLLMGAPSDSVSLPIGPYAAPLPAPLPAYVLPLTTATTLGAMLAAPGAYPNLTLALPSLTAGSGDPFFADAGGISLGVTSVSGWKTDTTAIVCQAAQAYYNPASHPGIPTPVWASAAALAASPALLRVTAATACMAAASCPACRIATALSGVPAGGYTSGPVVLLTISEFVCLDSYQQLTQAAALAGASAVLFVNPDDTSLALLKLVGLAPPAGREAIPSFAVTLTCGTALATSAAYVSLPAIVNGIAAGSTLAPPPPFGGSAVAPSTSADAGASPSAFESLGLTYGAIIVGLGGGGCLLLAAGLLVYVLCVRSRHRVGEQGASRDGAESEDAEAAEGTVVGLPAPGQPWAVAAPGLPGRASGRRSSRGGAGSLEMGGWSADRSLVEEEEDGVAVGEPLAQGDGLRRAALDSDADADSDNEDEEEGVPMAPATVLSAPLYTATISRPRLEAQPEPESTNSPAGRPRPAQRSPDKPTARVPAPTVTAGRVAVAPTADRSLAEDDEEVGAGAAGAGTSAAQANARRRPPPRKPGPKQ